MKCGCGARESTTMFFLGIKVGGGLSCATSSPRTFTPPYLDFQKKIPRRAINPAGFFFLWVAGARAYFIGCRWHSYGQNNFENPSRGRSRGCANNHIFSLDLGF